MAIRIESLVRFSLIPKCMTLNDLEWLCHVKFRYRADTSSVGECEFRKQESRVVTRKPRDAAAVFSV